MNKEKVFISGISGFIGSVLANKCLKEGYEVGGLIRQHPQFNDAVNNLRGKAKLYEGDLTDATSINNIIKNFQPNYIAHLGALTRVSYSFDHVRETMETNLGGTVNMVQAAQKYAYGLKKFILASSVETYGQQDEFMKGKIPMNENTPQKAGSPYAVWKIAGEHFVKQQFYANDFPGLCLRQTNTYGRVYDDYFVVEAFITQMLQNKKIVNFGHPKPIRAFLHIEDLTDLYIELFKCKNKDILGESFTIGPANGITIGKLAEIIKEKLNWNGKINWYTREIRSGEIFYLNTNNKKVTEMTGWKPKITLDEGLDRVIAYWKEKLKK